MRDIVVVDLNKTYNSVAYPSASVIDKTNFKELSSFFKNSTLEIGTSIAVATFVDRMNQKAKLLNMTNTKFTNPTGLEDDAHMSTARDMATMTRHAAGFSEIAKVWGAQSYEISIKGPRQRTITVKSTVINDSLNQDYTILGGKTGTNGDIANLVCCVADEDDIYYGAVIGTGFGSNDRFKAFKQLIDSAKKGISNASSVDAECAFCGKLPTNPLNYTNVSSFPLAEKNPDRIRRSASLTKVMTAIVALENLQDLDLMVKITSKDIKGGSGPIFYEGDTFSFRDALYLMLLPSSNTTAQAVSRVIGERIVRSGL